MYWGQPGFPAMPWLLVCGETEMFLLFTALSLEALGFSEQLLFN